MRRLTLVLAIVVTVISCAPGPEPEPASSGSPGFTPKADGMATHLPVPATVDGTVGGNGFVLYEVEVPAAGTLEVAVEKTGGTLRPEILLYAAIADLVSDRPPLSAVDEERSRNRMMRKWHLEGRTTSFLVVRARGASSSGSYELSTGFEKDGAPPVPPLPGKDEIAAMTEAAVDATLSFERCQTRSFEFQGYETEKDESGQVVRIAASSTVEGPYNYCATYASYGCTTAILPIGTGWEAGDSECDAYSIPE
jgi:hypothetical protein